MTIRLGAMAFVVGVRALLFVAAAATAAAVTIPFNVIQSRLPESEQPTFPRITEAREWLATQFVDRLPPWAEPHGDWMLLLTTTRGMDRLDAAVDRIPDGLVARWQRFAVRLMEVFLLIWAVLMLAFLAAAVWAIGVLAVTVAEWAIAYDWMSLFEPRAPPTFNPIQDILAAIAAIPQIALVLAALFAALTAFIILWWVVMLPILPGLTLHEFGHYAALRKSGASVDGYGLILFGPLLGGAFVQPGDDAALLGSEETFAVWSGGIANSVIWGSALIAAGVAVGGDPVAVLQAVADPNAAPFLDPILASILLLVGFIEIGNGFLNAVPVGPVDGGGFIRSVEQDWWGFNDALADITLVAEPCDGGES